MVVRLESFRFARNGAPLTRIPLMAPHPRMELVQYSRCGQTADSRTSWLDAAAALLTAVSERGEWLAAAWTTGGDRRKPAASPAMRSTASRLYLGGFIDPPFGERTSGLF